MLIRFGGLLVAGLVLIAGSSFLFPHEPFDSGALTAGPHGCSFDYTVRTMRLGEGRWHLDVAHTPEQLQCGLSHRIAVPEDAGMFFVFEEDDHHKIWMKDMQIPLDIFWLDEHYTVVDIAENVAPETYPEAFTPAVPARYVIELNAGSAEKFNIDIGTPIRSGL